MNPMTGMEKTMLRLGNSPGRLTRSVAPQRTGAAWRKLESVRRPTAGCGAFQTAAADRPHHHELPLPP
ncbi:hypothetical protein ABMY26_30585 [Azospirillum sp. HJ39]|uniref:hypothetical protein n=1 Tax=Azospirillum sp. HJ39 TaxID=3159496 RepID=UPI003555C454